MFWQNDAMKITLDLPDELLRRVKLRAAHHSRKLKEEIVQLLESGMVQAPEAEAPRRAPKPVRLRGRGPLTARDIEAAIAAGRDETRSR